MSRYSNKSGPTTKTLTIQASNGRKTFRNTSSYDEVFSYLQEVGKDSYKIIEVDTTIDRQTISLGGFTCFAIQNISRQPMFVKLRMASYSSGTAGDDYYLHLFLKGSEFFYLSNPRVYLNTDDDIDATVSASADWSAVSDIQYFPLDANGELDTSYINTLSGSVSYDFFNINITNGIIPGSFALNQFQRPYATCNIPINSGTQKLTSSSGLAVNTAYSFALEHDNDATDHDVTFTTDTVNVNWGGTNGVLDKINTAMKAHADANVKLTKATLDKDGDIRFTFDKSLTASKVELKAPGSGTTIFGVGVIPVVGSTTNTAPAMLKVATNAQLKDADPWIVFDDGNGNLYQGSKNVGTINYEDGGVKLKGLQPNSDYKIYYQHASVFGGDEDSTTADNENIIKEIKVQSACELNYAKAHIYVSNKAGKTIA